MKPLHFLIVEDSPYDVELVCQWLKHEFKGCDLTCVGSVRDALDYFAVGRYAASFVNLTLQHNRLAGIEVIKRFRERETDLPIYVVTGADDERIRRLAIAAGTTGFFLKDFNGTEAQIVRTAILGRKASLEKGGAVNKSWRTTVWGLVAALGTALSGIPMALLALKGTGPEMAEIVSALPSKLLAYSIFIGMVLAPVGLAMMGKSGRDQKEAEKHWEGYKKTGNTEFINKP